MTLLLQLVLWSQPARAQVPAGTEPVALTDEQREAEYRRLSEELHRFAQRHTWPAVEQSYRGCEKLGVPMRVEDHVQAAHAAQSRGDITLVRERLGRAQVRSKALGEPLPAELTDWMYTIDSAYSRLIVHAERGAKLDPKRRPFDPMQGRAIDFAADKLARDGTFDGLLPVGVYFVNGSLVDLSQPRSTLQFYAVENRTSKNWARSARRKAREEKQAAREAQRERKAAQKAAREAAAIEAEATAAAE